MGEELGLLFAVFVVVLFALIFIKGLQAAERSKEPFAYYMGFGLALMIALQALINFCVATGLAPTKGLPLPFISYGGSSLIVNMIAIGLLLNISRPRARNLGVDRFREAVTLKKHWVRKKMARQKIYGEIQ